MYASAHLATSAHACAECVAASNCCYTTAATSTSHVDALLARALFLAAAASAAC
jgi:hypothetical protein